MNSENILSIDRAAALEISSQCDADLQEILKSCRINPLEDIKEPPAAIVFIGDNGEIPSFTLGNFSMVIGKAKSKKTFLVGVLAAAAISGEEVIDIVQGKLPDDKRRVLYFDTEQAKYHAIKSIRRIADLSGMETHDNLIAYGLRKYKPDLRMRLIETAIYSYSDIGLVVIDGGRELLSLGINDEKSATTVTTEFLRWTEERNLHIVVVLHQNKNDFNARGHFGTECVNKAETTISVTESAMERSISVVHCEYSRDVAFDDFAFRIAEDGLPEGCEIPEGNSSQQNVSMDPTNLEVTFHQDILRKVFENTIQIRYGGLWRKIQEAVSQKSTKIGVNRAKEYITYYVNQGWLRKEKRIYTLNS